MKLARCRRGAILMTLAALAATGALGGAAWGADDVLVLGRRQRAPILTLDPWQASLELQAIGEYDSSTSGGKRTNGSDLALRETFNIGTGGGVISKQFFNWHAAVGLGVVEEWTSSPTSTRTTYGYTNTYDVGFSALNATDFPFSAYARRGESYINQSFAALVRDTITEYGATATYRSAVLPTSLRVSHSEMVQSDLTGHTQFFVNEDALEFNTRYRPSDAHELTLNYQYNAVEQTDIGTLSNNYQTNNVLASHQWNLDPAGQYVLTQTLSYGDQSGAFTYQSLSLDEQLQMQHTPNFSTALQYGYNQQSAPGTTTESHRLTGGFNHRLYQSLSTNGQAGYVLTQQTGGSAIQVNQWFANLSETYTKKVPLGLFQAYVNGGYNQTNSQGGLAPIDVLREGYTFNDPLPITLKNQNVRTSTLQVFKGSLLLREGVDYTVVTRNNQVQIRRVIGGALAADDAIAVNYQTLPTPPFTLDTITFGTGLRYDFREGFFKGLGMYARYSQQDQALTSEVPGIILPENIRDYLVGAEYEIYKIRFIAEQEWHESNLSPYNLTRFVARYSERISERTKLSIALQQSFVDYFTDRSALTTADARLSYDISRYLKASLYAAWRHEDSTRYGRTEGLEADAELRWDIRQTHIYVRLRNTMLETRGGENMSTFFQFGLRRDF